MKRKVIAEVLILLAMLAVILCSCGAKKTVAETIIVRDTVYIAHSDTIRDVKVVTRTDTLIREIERVVTLKDAADGSRTDTVRVIETRDNYRYIYVQDSTRNYRSIADSLLRILDEQHNKTTVKTRPQISWRWLFAVCAVFIVCLLVLRSRER